MTSVAMRLVNIDDDFQQVINGENDVWVTTRDIRDVNSPAQNYTVGSGTESTVKVEATEGNKYKIIHENQLLGRVKVPQSKIEVAETGITALDQHRSNFLVGNTKGEVVVIFGNKMSLRFQCFDWDISRCVFFPSGQLFLAVSNFCSNLWDILSGKCLRTFLGHTGAVTDLVTIGQTGRNFATASRDGTVLLWECGSGKAVKSLRNVRNSPVTCLSQYIDPVLTEKYKNVEHDLEFDTGGVVLVAGYEDGSIIHWDCFNGTQKHTHRSPDLVVAVVHCSARDLMILGHDSGAIRFWQKDGADFQQEIIINSGVAANFLRMLNGRVVCSSGNDTFVGVDIDDLSLETFSGVGNYNRIKVACGDETVLWVVGEGRLVGYK